MVTSGNSSRSSESTSPIDRCERSATHPPWHLGQEHQAELTDLYFVPVAQRGLLHAFPVEVRPVERTHVPQHEALRRGRYLGMASGDGHVVEEYIAVRLAPDGGQRWPEEKTGTGI